MKRVIDINVDAGKERLGKKKKLASEKKNPEKTVS